MIKRFRGRNGEKLVLDSYDEILKQWNVPVDEADIHTSFGETHVIKSGNPSNPSLLLFHGVGDNSALMWLLNAKDLCSRFYIIAVDTLGGPNKSVPSPAYFKGMDSIAWIDEIVETLGINTLYTVGVSNGALFAQVYAARRPNKVIKTVCMAGSVYVAAKSDILWRMLKIFFPEALFPNKRNTQKLMKKLCGTNTADLLSNELFMQHWLYLLKYNNPQAMMFHRVESLTTNELNILRNKALFLIGDCDRLNYHAKSLETLRANQMNYKILKDTGHALNHEHPEIITGEVLPFLLEQPGSKSCKP